MMLRFLLISLVFHSVFAKLKDLDPLIDWSILTENEAEYFRLKDGLNKQQNLIKLFQEVKIFMLRGEITKALKRLEELKIKYNDEEVRRVISFLEAKSYFILGEFDKAKNILQDNSLYTQNTYFRHTCYLDYLTSINVDVEKSIVGIERCIRLNFVELNTDSNWLTYINDHILDRNLNPDYFKTLLLKAKQFTKYKEVESWLKLGIYFNYENLIVKSLTTLPSIAILNDELRTLVAYNLYNSNNEDEASKFIDDIKNTNAFYLKSLLELKNNNLKVAHAHLLSAYQRKKFSVNINQLLLSTSWINEDYKNARYALNKLIPMKDYRIHQYILNTTLVYKEKSFFRAEKEVDFLTLAYMENLPFEGNILATNIYLNTQNNSWKRTSGDACKSFDPLNCWINMQSIIWEDYSAHYKKKTNNEWNFRYNENLNNLLVKKEDFKDSIFINQEDIEELDILDDPKMGEIEY